MLSLVLEERMLLRVMNNECHVERSGRRCGRNMACITPLPSTARRPGPLRLTVTSYLNTSFMNRRLLSPKRPDVVGRGGGFVGYAIDHEAVGIQAGKAGFAFAQGW